MELKARWEYPDTSDHITSPAFAPRAVGANPGASSYAGREPGGHDGYVVQPGAVFDFWNAVGPVTYVSGGIGSAEVAAMRQAEPRFPLTLEFAQRDVGANEYLAGVIVGIRNAKGERIVTTMSDGPLFLASLPDGRYEITAALGSQTQTRRIVVDHGHPQHLTFVW